MYNPGAFKTSLNYYRQDLASWEHLKISKSYFEFPWGEISKCTSFWCWEKKSRLYTSKHTSSCWRSLPGKSLHPSSGSLSLSFSLPPSIHPPCLLPKKAGYEPANQAGLVEETPREGNSEWFEGRGPQANDWMVQGVGGITSFVLLWLSSVLSNTAFPWKAEVVLPLHRASQRPISPFPQPHGS